MLINSDRYAVACLLTGRVLTGDCVRSCVSKIARRLAGGVVDGFVATPAG